jgi:hypothetical protein
MKPVQISFSQKALDTFCQRWKVRHVSLFGSVLRSDFRPDSDVDVLVTFDESTHWTLFDLVRMEDELEEIFERKVDLVSRRGLENSRNFVRRENILSTAEAIYVS